MPSSKKAWGKNRKAKKDEAARKEEEAVGKEQVIASVAYFFPSPDGGCTHGYPQDPAPIAVGMFQAFLLALYTAENPNGRNLPCLSAMFSRPNQSLSNAVNADICWDESFDFLMEWHYYHVCCFHSSVRRVR